MQFLDLLFYRTGGMEGASIEMATGRHHRLFVEHLGESPTGSPAVKVHFVSKDPLWRENIRFHLEATDLGFVPYYFLDELRGRELFVYAEGQQGLAVQYNVRARLTKEMQRWEETLSLLELQFGTFTVQGQQLELFS